MRKIYARNTILREISDNESHDFYAENHRQKSNSSLKLKSLGLFDGKELVGAISFCPPRTKAMKNKYSLELYRLCFKKNIRVPGGASKLIKSFIKKFHPADFFTYQDTTREATNVYVNSGMSLVKNEKIKKYLLAPDVKLEDARWGEKEIFTMAEVVRRGPDALLGTNLGEVFDGERRLTNPQLFTEILGWTEVEVSGDRLYEWVNENLTFYTYRITATNSDKYYYGVSHVKKPNATIEECKNDGYWGSGGAKFQNWRSKHYTQLEKEVLKTFSRKSPAYKEEKRLIKGLYKDDPNCLNSTTGGMRSGLEFIASSDNTSNENKICKIHGVTKHRGDSCLNCVASKSITIRACREHGNTKHRGSACSKCVASGSVSFRDCSIHGETKHRGESCTRCASIESIHIKTCPIHGKTKHQGNSCSTCSVNNSISLKNCPIHGETKHQGDSCSRCSILQAVSFKVCVIHGETKHMGNFCSKCVVDEATTLKICPIHGETKHRGEACSKCVSSGMISLKVCPIHGETAHMGETCYSCHNESLICLKVCPIHGRTKHRGTACSKCTVENATTLKKCPIHGETTHRGNSCSLCHSQSSISIKTCPIHGDTKHNGDSCSKCTAVNATIIKHCPKHGDTKHRGKACSKCVSASMTTLKDCPVHGETKHRGESCFKCAAAKRKKS